MMIQGSTSKGWLHKEGGFNFTKEYYFDPFARKQQDERIEKFLQKIFPELSLHNLESKLVNIKYVTSDMIYVGAIQPNLIIGVLLGSDFIFPADGDADISTAPLSGITKISDLPDVDILCGHPLIKKFEAQIEMIKQDNPELSIIPPFFWDLSGRATIHGFFTTAFKLIGQKVFMLLYDDPDFINGLHGWLAELYMRLIDKFANIASIEVTGIHIGECSGSLISPAAFMKFILPYSNLMGETYGQVRFHSCGYSDHLLDGIAAITNLSSLDTGSNTSVGKIRSIMGQDFLIELAPPVEILLSSSDKKNILKWLDVILDENNDGPLCLSYHLEPGYSISNIIYLHEELICRGLVERYRVSI